MQVWNVLHVACWKYRMQKWCKNRHLGTIAQFSRAVYSQLRHVSTIGKKLVKQQYLLHMCPQYGELRPTSSWDRFGSLGHPSYFQRLPRLGSVTARHVHVVVGISQTLRRWTEGATCVRQGDHHVGHWRTFLVLVALRNRADNYIFILFLYGRPMLLGRPYIFSSCFFLLLLSFFSSPNLSSRRLDVYHTSAHGVVRDVSWKFRLESFMKWNEIFEIFKGHFWWNFLSK